MTDEAASPAPAQSSPPGHYRPRTLEDAKDQAALEANAPAALDTDGTELRVNYSAMLPPKIANESAAERSREVRAWINYAMDMFVTGEGDLEEAVITISSETIEDRSLDAATPIAVRGQQFIRIEGPHVREALRAETREAEAAARRAEQVDLDGTRVVRSPADAHLEPAPTTRTEQVIVVPDLPRGYDDMAAPGDVDGRG